MARNTNLALAVYFIMNSKSPKLEKFIAFSNSVVRHAHNTSLKMYQWLLGL